MTLDEAILHSEEKAEQLCGKCAEEHAQLAEWLKELKIRRETIEAEPVKHGYWKLIEVEGEDYFGNVTRIHLSSVCSVCGHGTELYSPSYCPACGAKMEV